MMTHRLVGKLIGAAVTSALTLAPASAQDDSDRLDQLERQFEQLMNAYSDLQSETEELRNTLSRLEGDPLAGGDEFYIPRQAAEFEASQPSMALGGIYTKPFLTKYGQSTYMGGYIDLEFSDPRGDSTSKEFDQHRFVPFIYSDVSDRVKVLAEIEYEHGSELEVEFAQMDYLVNDGFNLRAGIQLIPVGKFNEVHDSPIQELTSRPMVNRYIIPSTFRDAGVGAWGNITDTLYYQTSITNGFRGLDAGGTSAINNKDGLRKAAPQSDELDSPFSNTNDKLMYAGRLAYKPVLGTEFGISGLSDKYDEAGNRDLNLWALDATVHGSAVPFMPDNVELLYEGAWVDLERDVSEKAAGVAGDMGGHYVQANVFLEPGFLQGWQDNGFVEDGARFTFVTRYGMVDLDDYTRRRTTVGLNFRPNATYSVVKLDYQFNSDSGANQGSNDADALLFSFATYF